MAEKHLKSKETDITGALVIALVVLIGVLIVKVTGDFTSQKTSSSTRAARRASAADYIPFCKGKLAENLGSRYNVPSVTSLVFAKLGINASCGSGYTRFAVGLLSVGGINQPTEPGSCCVSTQPLYVVNDNFCTLMMPSGHWPDGKTVEHIPSVCKDKSDCTGSYGTVNTDNYTVTTSYKCDNVGSTSVKKDKNYCCMMPLAKD